ncbi:MAG: hypothetical protein ACE5EC_09480, partial [Phycisphaerae bacterium]
MYTTTLSLGLIILSHGPAPRRGLDGAIPRFESVRSEIVAPDADDRGSSLSGLPAWWQHVRNSISLGFRDVSQALHKARGAGWNTFRTGRVQADSRGSIHPANERIDREYPLAAAGTLVGSDEDFPAGDKLDPLWRIGHAALLAASDYGDGDYYPEILGPTMNEAIGHAWIGSDGDDPPIEALDFTMLSRSAVARGDIELEIPPENADPAWFEGADPPDDRSAEDAAPASNSKGEVAGDEVTEDGMTEDGMTGDEAADPRKDAPPPAPPDSEEPRREEQPVSADDQEPESRDSP